MSKVEVILTINLSPETQKAIASFGASLERAGSAKPGKPAPATEEVEEKSHIDMADIKAKRGKKGKKADPEPEADEPDVEEEEEEEADEPEVDADDEGEDFDEPEAEDTLDEKSLAKLKAALKAHSAKNGKPKAVAVLKKYAERSDLVKPADLPKLLKALAV